MVKEEEQGEHTLVGKTRMIYHLATLQGGMKKKICVSWLDMN